MSDEALWLQAFALTVAIEAPLYAVILRRRFARAWEGWVLGVALQALTHPALWFLAPRFEPYWAWVAVMELGVWAAEAGVTVGVIGRGSGWGRSVALALLAAGVANGASTLAGLVALG